MNTYRITVTTTRGPDQKSQVHRFDVDALRPTKAIERVLSHYDADLITVTSQVYAKNIFPLNGNTIRNVGA
ncbi:hypothetical protein LCGC14_0639780 [marine sediment metagenome]|uniref:Uncharacterized protein n=1 Tax=marine sediment metagenome TaxID=412755 RepID=A0A0F9U7T7_9ZZZZ